MRNITENRILERNFVLMGIDNLLQLTLTFDGFGLNDLGQRFFLGGGGGYNINYCTSK